MPPQQAWQLVKAYQDAIAAGTSAHRFSPDEQAGHLIVRLGVFQAQKEAERQASLAHRASDSARYVFWSSVHQALSTCLRPP